MIFKRVQSNFLEINTNFLSTIYSVKYIATKIKYNHAMYH